MNKKERQAEIIRRRNARLSIWSPGTFYVQYKLTELGGLYDRRFRQFVFPDQESLDKAKELVDIGEKMYAKRVIRSYLEKCYN